MKRLGYILLLVAALVPFNADPAEAQRCGSPWADEENHRSVRYACLPSCDSADDRARLNRSAFTVANCASVTDCATSGTLAVRMICQDTGWVAQNYTSVDLSAYVPVTKEGQQSIAATGEGNDITFEAADTIVLRIASLKSLVMSSDTDTLTVESTGATDSEVDIVASNAEEPNSRATLGAYSEDGAAVAYLDVPGATIQADQASGTVRVQNGGFRVYSEAAPPIACDAGSEGVEYFNTTIHKKCICNGTAYVLASDDTTTTGCTP